MSMKEEIRRTTNNLFSGTTRPSKKEMEARAREIAAVTNTPYDEAYKRLENYWKIQGREPVLVWVYGPGDKDFTEDKVLAEVLDPNGKPRKGFAWRDEDTEELTLATADELKLFKEEHPDYKFSAN